MISKYSALAHCQGELRIRRVLPPDNCMGSYACMRVRLLVLVAICSLTLECSWRLRVRAKSENPLENKQPKRKRKTKKVKKTSRNCRTISCFCCVFMFAMKVCCIRGSGNPLPVSLSPSFSVSGCHQPRQPCALNQNPSCPSCQIVCHICTFSHHIFISREPFAFRIVLRSVRH